MTLDATEEPLHDEAQHTGPHRQRHPNAVLQAERELLLALRRLAYAAAAEDDARRRLEAARTGHDERVAARVGARMSVDEAQRCLFDAYAEHRGRGD